MNRVIAWLKGIRLGQILTVFLAGVLLFVSTACSNGGVQAATGSRQEVPAGLQTGGARQGNSNPRPEVPEKAVKSPFQGGSTMNEFPDTDPRLEDTKGGRARGLIENAQRNVDPRGGNAGDKIKRSIGDVPRDASKNIQRGTEDAKNAVQDATRDAARGVKGAAEDVKQGVRENTPDAGALSRDAKRATEDVTEDTKAASGNIIDKAKQAIEDTADRLQGKVDETANTTQRAVDDVVK